jgi:hypothetical protein
MVLTLSGTDGVTGPNEATMVKAWVNFNGSGTVAIRDDGGVSSITDNGTGEYSVTYTNAWAAVDYSFTGTCGASTTDSRNCGLSFDDFSSTPSTTVHDIVTRRRDNNTNLDTEFNMCQVTGSLA